MSTRGWFAGAAVIVLLGCGSHAAAPAPAPTIAPAPAPAPDAIWTSVQALPDDAMVALVREHRMDSWYSVFLLDQRAGWGQMEARPTRPGEPGAYMFSMRAHLELATPDGTSQFEKTTASFYAGTPPFALIERREQTTGDSVTEHAYRATAGGLELVTTTDGVAAPARHLPATAETLRDPFLVSVPPAHLVPGQRIRYVGFEDDATGDEQGILTIVGVADEVVAGIKVRVVTAETRDDGESVATRLRIAGGQTLSIALGEGMRVELSDRQRAQSGIEAAVLLDTAVAVDRKLGPLAGAREVTLLVGTKDGFVFPSGPQQQVTPTGDGKSRITLRSVPGPAVTAAERTRARRSTSAFDADDPAIAALARLILDGARTDRERVDRLVGWVYRNLEKDLATDLSSASQVLAHGRGDCTEHTLLVVALARAAGIPARDVSGLLYVDDQQRFFWHAWAQVELDGHWVAVDAAWDQPIADPGHLMFSVEGGDDSYSLGGITITAAP